MDFRRLMIFIVISLALLLGWEKYITPPPTSTNNITSNNQNNNQATPNTVNDNYIQFNKSNLITVSTDLIQAKISSIGGDIRQLNLMQHGETEQTQQAYQLLQYNPQQIYIAQSGFIIDGQNFAGADQNTIYQSMSNNYVMKPSANTLTVSLNSKTINGISIIKNFIFHRDSYVIDINYQINNNSAQALNNTSTFFRLLRDQNSPSGETKFVRTFNGAAYYTEDNKFNKIDFKDIIKNDLTYPETINNGWIGFIQHYFITMWLLSPTNANNICINGISCRFNFKTIDDHKLISAGVILDLPTIKPHSNYTVTMPLFAGPQEYKILINTAPGLNYVKDYGWVYIFASPLFWLLTKIFSIISGFGVKFAWGWAIILLTLVVKIILYPLTSTSYKSMARMKLLAPKIEILKSQHPNDKIALQKAMMDLYRREKINPIGGCLPMILQIPIFLGLYWALLSSVELRQAGFLWINDLSRPDPYYILPIVLALSMFAQGFLNPPVADPIQAKMMRYMPLAFSIMFFFFPAGLVIYWLVNNLITMAQQWYINNHVIKQKHQPSEGK